MSWNMYNFIKLCLIGLYYQLLVNLYDKFIHILQGCFTVTEAIILPWCQWSKPEEYSWVISTSTQTHLLQYCLERGCLGAAHQNMLLCRSWLQFSPSIMTSEGTAPILHAPSIAAAITVTDCFTVPLYSVQGIQFVCHWDCAQGLCKRLSVIYKTALWIPTCRISPWCIAANSGCTLPPALPQS